MGEIIEQPGKLVTQADAVIYFLQRMDIDMVNALLVEDRTYQDFEKHVFINLLDVALNKFISAGDTFLNRYGGICESENCNYKCKGFSFIGNNSGNYFDLIIEVQGGYVLDIYECFSFRCLGEHVTKNVYIRLDNDKAPF